MVLLRFVAIFCASSVMFCGPSFSSVFIIRNVRSITSDISGIMVSRVV